MAKKQLTQAEIEQEAAALQTEQAATAGGPVVPLTGVEIARMVADKQPQPPAPGTRYRVAEASNAAVTVDVVSADGTIEDCVRAFNQGRAVARTRKQLLIEQLPD